MTLSRGLFITVMLCVVLSAMSAHAMNFVRDAEAENLVADIARPIFKAAGIYKQHLKVRLIMDPEPNAFVADSRHIFIHTGLLSIIPSAEALAGVIAHECGHITSHHISIKGAQMRELQQLAALGTALSIVVGAASGDSAAAIGANAGVHEALVKNMLKYNREHEVAADEAAIRYMHAAGLSVRGLAEFLRILATEERLAGASYVDAYWQTHPPTKQRLANFLRAENQGGGSFPRSIKERFALVVAKIDGYTKPQNEVFSKYSGDDLPSLYARSIALYRHGQVDQGLQVLDRMIAKHSDNPYLQELYGQILYENGRGQDAVAHYNKAIAMRPLEPMFDLELAIALINPGASIKASIPQLKRAEKMLLAALDIEPDNSYSWQQLGVALHNRGDELGYRLALAKAHLAVGDVDGVQRNLALIKTQLPSSPSALPRRYALWLADIESSLADTKGER